MVTRTVTHPSRTSYLRGCRCDECRSINARYAREQLARKRAGRVPNPNLQKAGRDAARVRWGEVPRTVSIRHLSDSQRLEVLAFVRLLERDA
jgi:hypothetical protein